MKHLEDIQKDLLTGSIDGNPDLFDTRVDGVGIPVDRSLDVHVRQKPESKPFQKPRLGMAKNFLLLSLLFFVIAIGYFAYVFGRGAGSVSERNINVQVVGSSFVTSGAESLYEMVIENTNASAINDVVASIEIPQPGGDAPISIEKSVGAIAARSQKKAVFPVTIFGAQFDDRELTGTIQFSFPGSRATLQRSTIFPVRIAQSPVRLEVFAPERLVVGQETVVNITTSTQSLLTGVGVKVEYPEGFEVISTSVAPAAGNYFWEFSRLAANKVVDIKITGIFRGLPIDGSTTAFRVSVGAVSRDERILSNIYATKTREVVVGQSGINATLLIGQSSESSVAVFPGSDIPGVILVTNTIDKPIRNVSLRLDTDSSYIDLGRSRFGTGFIDTATPGIRWSEQGGATDLALLAPGQTVRIEFTLGGKQNWIGTDMGTLSVDVQGQVDGGELLSALDVDTVTLVQSARLGLLQKTLFSNGPFDNSGDMPPRVGAPTTYTIEWSLPRQVTSFDEVSVTGTLPVYVKWMGEVFPDNAPVSYDVATRTITWKQGKIPVGMTTDPSVSFQLSVTPAITQKQTTPIIVDSIMLSGINLLTGERFNYNKPGHTTRLRGDAAESSGSVVE